MKKLVKKIVISNNETQTLSATLLVDVDSGHSGWLLHITRNGETVEAGASSATVSALMMAERDFKACSTGFYEVDSE